MIARRQTVDTHPEPSRWRGLRWMIGALAGLLLVSGLAWVAGEWALSRLLDRTVLRLQEAGLQVATEGRTRGGWPLSARLTLRGVTVATASGDTTHNFPLQTGTLPLAPVRWEAAALTLQASVLHPFSVALIAGGTQRLRLGALPEAMLWGDRVAAYLPWRVRQPLRLPVEARALHVALAATGPDGVTTIAATHGHLLFSPGGNLAAALDLDGLTLPEAGPHPFGRVVDRLAVALALPPGLGMPGWPGDAPLLLQEGRLDWGRLHLTLGGTLRFDPVVGRFSLGVAGLHEALMAATEDGLLPPGQAASVNGLLGLLQHADGGGDRLSGLPVLVRDGVVSLGTVPLYRLW